MQDATNNQDPNYVQGTVHAELEGYKLKNSHAAGQMPKEHAGAPNNANNTQTLPYGLAADGRHDGFNHGTGAKKPARGFSIA